MAAISKKEKYIQPPSIRVAASITSQGRGYGKIQQERSLKSNGDVHVNKD
jgi:hypothetical protein